MKQMKFLLVALMTVLMGMSVTSCMNGDDNTIYTGPAFAKCTNYFPATFELANGQKLVVNELSMPNLNIGRSISSIISLILHNSRGILRLLM